jgi:hypothetical protein
MSNPCHRIDIEPASLGERGQRYLVRHAGAVLVASSRTPEFDACRVLLAKGITGQLEVWHTGAAFPALGLDITKGAGLTVEESDRVGPRFARWQSRSEGLAANAVSASGASPRTAADKIRLGKPPAQQDRPENRPARANFRFETATTA